jgi:hypothetical protein
MEPIKIELYSLTKLRRNDEKSSAAKLSDNDEGEDDKMDDKTEKATPCSSLTPLLISGSASAIPPTPTTKKP